MDKFSEAIKTCGAELKMCKRETYDFCGFSYSPQCGHLPPIFNGPEKLLTILMEWKNCFEKNEHLRLGQSLYQALSIEDADFAAKILATEKDPFYDDAKVSVCLEELQKGIN